MPTTRLSADQTESRAGAGVYEVRSGGVKRQLAGQVKS